MLGDETLELLSNVYIGYALLFEGKPDEAKVKEKDCCFLFGLKCLC